MTACSPKMDRRKAHKPLFPQTMAKRMGPDSMGPPAKSRTRPRPRGTGWTGHQTAANSSRSRTMPSVRSMAKAWMMTRG